MHRITVITFLRISAFMLLIAQPACVGYRLGNTKPVKLKHVKNIYIPLVVDKTQEIKLAPQATNEIVKALSNDGTYRITREDNSDATLKATVNDIQFKEFRSSRLDTLRAAELTMNISIHWRLVDRSGKELMRGRSLGSTRYFADDNQRLSRDNAKANALQKASQQLTSRLSNGF